MLEEEYSKRGNTQSSHSTSYALQGPPAVRIFMYVGRRVRLLEDPERARRLPRE